MPPEDDNQKQNPAGAEDPGAGKEGEEGNEEPKTFSQEDLDRIAAKTRAEVKAKADKAAADAIKKAREEWEAEAKLTAEEKVKKENEKRETELAEKLRSIAIRENRAEARDILQEKAISTDLVDWVVDEDIDKTKENIEKLETAWNKAIEDGVNKKMAGSTPKDKSTPVNSTPAGKADTRSLLYGK
jgi:hypothetical protein